MGKGKPKAKVAATPEPPTHTVRVWFNGYVLVRVVADSDKEAIEQASNDAGLHCGDAKLENIVLAEIE